jgi:hypothetical protein
MPDDPEKPEKTALDDAKAALDDKPPDETERENAKQEEDAANPEAIARRVAAFGEEDEIERIARVEEQKLAERRKAQKKGKGKGSGLEAAASKRLAKIGTKAQPKRAVATAVDVDPLIERTQRLRKWAKQNQKAVRTMTTALVIAGAAVGGYLYYEHKHESDASALLAKAVADERGRIGDPNKDDDPDRPHDPRPVFKTSDERRDSALAKYRDVEEHFPGTGAAILARLAEGGILLDKHDPDAAIRAYSDVKASALAQADAEVRGRALEGLGFAYELKGNLDDAVKTFRELENTVDVQGFKELGMYHQARCYEAKGDKDKAKELLKALHERINKPGEGHPFPYLQELADDRLRALDPTALPPKPSGSMAGPGGNKMSDEQMRKLIEQFKKSQEQQGGGGGK